MKISTLYLPSNNITGTVPSALCSDELLSVLSFDSNAISCYAPCLSSVASLQNGAISACKDSSAGSMIPSLNPTPWPDAVNVSPSAGEIVRNLSIRAVNIFCLLRNFRFFSLT